MALPPDDRDDDYEIGIAPRDKMSPQEFQRQINLIVVAIKLLSRNGQQPKARDLLYYKNIDPKTFGAALNELIAVEAVFVSDDGRLTLAGDVRERISEVHRSLSLGLAR